MGHFRAGLTNGHTPGSLSFPLAPQITPPTSASPGEGFWGPSGGLRLHGQLCAPATAALEASPACSLAPPPGGERDWHAPFHPSPPTSPESRAQSAGCVPCPPGGMLRHSVHHTELIIQLGRHIRPEEHKGEHAETPASRGEAYWQSGLPDSGEGGERSRRKGLAEASRASGMRKLNPGPASCRRCL